MMKINKIIAVGCAMILALAGCGAKEETPASDAKKSSVISSSDANDAKEWVKTNWNLRDDIQNLPLAKDIKLSTRTGKNYFNITIEQDKQVKSYNFA